MPSTQRGFWNPLFPQLLPHAPQLLKLSLSSVHWPLQLVEPGRHAHWPPVQNWRDWQVLPHCPQSSGSCAVSAQIWFCWQSVPAHAHWPLAHVSPVSHWFWQLPHACG